VYWPILLVYFLLLFALTMRRQIEYVYDYVQCFYLSDKSRHICYWELTRRHMIKYKYIPFDLGRKARYAGKK
jgi:hypothetical protein